MKRIKGIIFDADGTLLDSMQMWRTIASEYIKSQGCVPESGLDTRVRNITTTECAEYFINNYGLKKSAEEICSEIKSRYESFYAEEVSLKPGVKEFLEKMHSEGVKMCIATATYKGLVNSAVSRHGCDKYFCDIITCDEVGAGKDKPDIFYKSAEILGFEPCDIAVFEDSLHAVKTAVKAGFYVVGVYDSTSDDDWNDICKISDYNKKTFEDI